MTNKRKVFNMGMSSAASWAWGTSLIMGQQIVQEKGIIAFWIWAGINALTLAVFGFLHNKGIIKPEIYRSKYVKSIALIIQMFCLLVQLNFINQIFGALIDNKVLTYGITFTVGAIFVLAMFKKGLRASIFTDVIQWAVALVSIVVIVSLGIFSNAELFVFPVSKSNDIMWGVWSAIVLLAGPIGDVQHWQRAEADKTKKGYYLGALLFLIYMFGIFAMAHFHFTSVMNVILLITVLCVTTSTIDSIAVAMHEIGNKKIGTAICLIICAGWGLLAEIGMINLWSSFGVIRVVLAVSILLLPLFDEKKYKITIPSFVLTVATLVFFTLSGNIGVGNVFGIICEVTAAIMLAYILVSMIKGTSKLYLKGNDNVKQEAEYN